MEPERSLLLFFPGRFLLETVLVAFGQQIGGGLGVEFLEDGGSEVVRAAGEEEDGGAAGAFGGGVEDEGVIAGFGEAVDDGLNVLEDFLPRPELLFAQ